MCKEQTVLVYVYTDARVQIQGGWLDKLEFERNPRHPTDSVTSMSRFGKSCSPSSSSRDQHAKSLGIIRRFIDVNRYISGRTGIVQDINAIKSMCLKHAPAHAEPNIYTTEVSSVSTAIA